MEIKESIIKVLGNQSFIGAILIALIFIIIAFILQPKFRAGLFNKIGLYSYKNNGNGLKCIRYI